MIDLHLHLDGSLSIEDFKFLAKKQGFDLGDSFPQNIYVNEDCRSLEEYLERFNLPLCLLQDAFSIAYVTRSLIIRLNKMGYIYAEIRFAPQLHTQKGLSQEDAVLAAIEGLEQGLKDCPTFKANLILCCMRQSEYDVNLPAILLADKYRDRHVVSVDLAGPEAFHTGDYYIPLFNEAKKREINVIIHAGEACGSSEVMIAINDLHAQRIGHGVHLEINDGNLKIIKSKKIAFEFCPTSNLQTTSLPNYEAVPLKEFMDNGICVTINSDNMTVSNTDVNQEFRHLKHAFNLSEKDIKKLLKNSIKASFTTKEEKQALRKELESRFSSFYLGLLEIAS